MFTRRLLIVLAVLMGLTAITAGLSPPPDRRERDGAASPTAAPAPGGAPASVMERTLDAAAPEPRTIEVREGDQVRLTVEADAADAVELVGLDRIAPVAPGTPAVFDVLADEPGSYPVALLDAGRRVGVLRVTPAAG